MTAHVPSVPDRPRRTLGAGALALGLAASAFALTAWQLGVGLPPARWLAAASGPSAATPAELVMHYAALPRVAVAALAGAGLGAAGCVVQHVLRNPLASPVTLGVSSGAQLALVVATLLLPGGVGGAADLVATAGGLAAMALVMGVAAPGRFSSLAVILSGLAVGLFAGSLGHVLKLFNQEYLAAVLLWNAGSVAQEDWSVAARLLPRLALLGAGALLLLRPMGLVGLGDDAARGLGVPVGVLRALALGVAVGMAATVTAAVGTVGFVEIAAPLIARAAGARRLGARLPLAAVIGAALLVSVDALVQALNRATGADLPTGAATAMLAAPLLLALLPRMRASGDPVGGARGEEPVGRRRPAGPPLAVLAVLLTGVLLLSCAVGRVGTEWTLLTPETAASLLPWRWPRAVTAGAAGAMLGAAGAILQRTTGNPLAGPETLGLGSAAMAGLAVALLLVPSPTAPMLFGAGTLASIALLAALVGAGWRSRFAPDHLLLTGLALAAALDAVVIAFLAANDGRAGLLLGWMAGSTASAEAGTALALAVAATVLVPAGLLLARPLDLLPLGDAVARGLGLGLLPVRAAALGLAALLTAAAVLAVGPLTFVGLVGPHLARRLGLARTAGHLPASALAGAVVMVAADALGRLVASPFEVPAGLVASLIGCPYLLAQLRGRPGLPPA